MGIVRVPKGDPSSKGGEFAKQDRVDHGQVIMPSTDMDQFHAAQLKSREVDQVIDYDTLGVQSFTHEHEEQMVEDLKPLFPGSLRAHRARIVRAARLAEAFTANDEFADEVDSAGRHDLYLRDPSEYIASDGEGGHGVDWQELNNGNAEAWRDEATEAIRAAMFPRRS